MLGSTRQWKRSSTLKFHWKSFVARLARHRYMLELYLVEVEEVTSEVVSKLRALRSRTGTRLSWLQRWHFWSKALLRQGSLILAAYLIVLATIDGPVRAQDQQSRGIVSSCRSNTPPAASGKAPSIPPAKGREAQAAYIAASSFLRVGAYGKALERLNEAIEFDPDNARLYASRADAFLRNRQVDKALDDYNHSIAVDPTSSLAFLGRGEVYVRMLDHDRAIDDFSEAVKLFPGNARAYLRRGEVHASWREYDRAVEDLDQSVKLDSQCPSTYNVRGQILDLKGNHDLANVDYDRAIELDPHPGNATAFLRRARSYEAKRAANHAMSDLEQALKLEPRNAFFLNSRCFFKAILGDPDGALADCNEALKVRPDEAAFLDSRGFAYLRKGTLNNSIEDYDAALRIDNKRSISLYGRAVAKRQKGDLVGSETDISAALAAKPNVADEAALYGLK